MPRLHPRLNAVLTFLRRQLPPLNFLTIHYLYFILTCIAFSLVFWGASTPFGKVNYRNALFLCVSAMTEAGLNTVNLSELNTFQQFLLFVLIMLGSAIWVSAFVVHVRLRAFEQKMLDVDARRGRLRRVLTFSRRPTSEVHRRDEEIAGETVADKDGTSHNSDEGSGSGVASALEKTVTPPERRGGPEMNETPGEESADPIEEAEDRDAESVHGQTKGQGISFADNTRFRPTQARSPAPQMRRQHSNLFDMSGVGAISTPASFRPSLSYDRLHPPHPAADKAKHGDISKHFDSVAGWIARNSQFHNLSEKEREALGGCEYRAVQLLAWLVPVYFVLWQLLGCLGCAAWVAYNKPEVARANGLNPWWVGAFNAVSAFNNSGMSLLDANMVAFQKSYYLLITMSLLILAGNTTFPIFLRMIVWALWKIATRLAVNESKASDPWTERTKTLRFLLDHPRRCYTNLFPSQHTWWLAASVFFLNGFDWAMFEILNIGNKALDRGLAARYRVIDGLFQAFAVRAGGFYVVPIPSLRIALLVLYVVMMYISAYPVLITIRNSNVYEERSLGIYADEQDDVDAGTANEEKAGKSKTAIPTQPGLLKRVKTIHDDLTFGRRMPTHETNSHFVRYQLRAQLAHDAWCIVLALFLIMIIESSHFNKNPVEYSVFNFLFEIVSAYGTVGISIGVPNEAYSFCGAWHPLSQLILCVVMLRGRHRGLPVAIDKAVLLPGAEAEMSGAREEEDGRIRRVRTWSRNRDGEV